MSNGIILAGGLGSRLGPLSAQISKALVSIGQRPHIFHQIELLRAAGCKEIIVVVNNSTQVQVSSSLERAGIYDVKFVVQKNARGPVDAILSGLERLPAERRVHSTYVLMSDTFIEEPLARSSQTWFGIGPAPVRRSFCARNGQGHYVDAVVQAGTDVTIGAYYFADTFELHKKAVVAIGDLGSKREIGMGRLLSQFHSAKMIGFSTWLDIGDMSSLAKARRARFIARSSHTLTLDSAGILTKTGAGQQFEAQRNWLIEQSGMGDRSANLIPRLYGTKPGGPNGYAMEYVDLPTLSELWLYWPGRPDTWTDILVSIVDRLERDLWWTIKPYETHASSNQVHGWFTGKAHERLASLDHGLAARHFDMLERASRIFTSSAFVRAHGDLNFNNILYSINTGTFKLIDPRGTPFMPLVYELAKLRYSYHGGFSAITHGLFREDGILMPDRQFETEEMDKFLQGYVSLEQLQVAEGCLLIAGAPLHSLFEREVMIKRGVKLIKEIVG